MGLFDFFKVRTSNQPLTLEQIIQDAKPAAPPMSLSTVYRCVTVISESVAMLPVNLYEVSGEAMRKLTALDHPLTRVLNYAPDSRMTRYTFLQAIVRSMLLRGNAFAHIKRQGGNVELVFIHPDKVEIVRKKADNKIPYLTYKVEGFDRQLDASEVLHFINLSDDGLEGESVLTHARRSLSIAGNAETQAENYYNGDGMPSGILSIASRMTPEQKEANYKTWRERMTNNPGGVMILEGTTQSYTPINISAADRQLLEVRAFSVQDICRFFGCSPVKAFDLSHSSYSTVEALQLEFLTDTLQPMLTNIEMELHRKLFYGADAAKYAVKFDTGELLRADKSSQAQYYSQLVQLGLMTPNEARIELNLPPMKGGNALYMQGAMMPVEQIINNNKNAE